MRFIKVTLVVLFTIWSINALPHGHDDKYGETEWIKIFKELSTYYCICEITDNDIVALLARKKDYSYVVHGEILNNQAEYADSLGRRVGRGIPRIPVRKDGKFSTVRDALVNCIRIRDDRLIDSIARQQYKLYLKDIETP